MCDSINETLKLKQQDKAKLTFFILQHIHKLNNFLKCCICFELFDKPTKTNCGHLFCKSCINKHMSYYSSEEIAPCPICMLPLAEFESFSIHLQYEGAVEFVKELLKHTTNFQIDIEEPPNFKSILEKIEQNTSEKEIELCNKMTNFESDSRYKSILKSRKFLISTDSKVFLSESASANFPNKLVADINTVPQINNLQTEVNQFDLLLNETKKLKPIKTYQSAKKPQKEVISTEIEKLLKIRKQSNNSKALQWLQDARNNFENLPTQSETTENLKESIPKFDLPSISQNKKPQFNSNPNKINQNKMKRVTRSMGGSSKVTQAKTRERHSIAACDNLSIPMNIEQFSSEEMKSFTGGLQDLELQCLNNIDKEMLQEESSTKKTIKPGKLDKSKKVHVPTISGVSKRTRKEKGTLNATSSLDKFKEMKKIISKTERKPNKLPVVLNLGSTLCKVVTSVSAIDVNDQPFVVIENCNLANNRSVASSSKRKIEKANVMDNEIYNFSKPLKVPLTRIDYANKNNELHNSAGPTIPNKKFNKSEKSKRTLGLKIKSSKIIGVDSLAAKETKAGNRGILTEQTKDKENIAKNNKEKEESDFDENNFNKLTQSMNETIRQVPTSDNDDDIFNVLTQSLFIEPHKLPTNVHKPDKQFGELDLPQQLEESMEILTKTVGLLQNYSSQLNPKTKEYLGNFITDTLKTINKLLYPDHEVKVEDVCMQSSLPKANLVDLAIQTDPSILNLENNLAEMGVQTDCSSPQRGLYISSTDMFNTPSVADAEIQTDFLPCSNCNHKMINSTTKERNILSESFDNIQFETQDLLKGKQNLELRLQISTIKNQASPDVPSLTSKTTKDTSKRLRTQNSTDDLFAKDDGFDNVQFDTQQILKDKSNLEIRLLPSDKNSNPETSALSNSKSPRQTSKRLCKQNFTDQLLEKDDGFDKIQFIETQDFLKGKHSLKVQSPSASSYKSPRRTSKRLRKSSSAKDENFETEVIKNQHNLKEHLQPRTPTSSTKKSEVGSPTCDPPRRTSKRLRIQNTPEDELLPKDVKRNKYINEDTSLQFLSDEIGSSNHPIEFGDSDFSNYEECLNDVLKKYEPDDASKNPKKISQTISKTQNAIQECNVIINGACSEAITIENTENLDKTVKYLKQKPSPCTLLILQDEFSKDFDNTSKIVKTSETRKEVLQSEKVEKSVEKQVPYNLEDNFKEIDMSMENIPNHLSNSTNIENLPQNVEENCTKSNKSNAIVVLQNVVIPKEIDAALIEELNKSFDDVFLSDSDVVETTPQKSKIVSCEELLSQAYYNPVPPLALPPLIESSPDVISSLDPPLLTCFNMTFAPPPEFQDLSNPKNINNLDESLDVTLKPESNSVQIVHDSKPILSSVTPDLFMEAHNMVTSTPAEASQIISHSLNLSPIRPTCQEPLKLQNPIEAAHNSMISPLNIVKSQSNLNHKNSRPFTTSTPKQKSILNFIKNKKPCVSCTRLSKPEVATIRTLSDKNMFTYSVNFNSSVTHLIVSVDDQQYLCDHTMKYISAVAAGIWIVSFNWIQECVIRDQIVSEEQFEVLDISGMDGPRQSRLNRISNPLFRGYKIYISPPFQAVIEKDIEEVIVNLGGEVVPSLNDLLKKNGKICIIIAEAKSSKDFEMYNSWLEKLKVITVEMEWLSRSVGQYKIVNFRHFALCSDENICGLGYPPKLTSDLPFNSCSTFSSM